MASSSDIEIKVHQHPSGNLTLQERNIGDTMWKDLYTTSDALSFYRAAVRKLADYAAQGIIVKQYTDITP